MPSRYKLEQLGAKILNELFGVIDNPEEEISEVEDEIVAPTAATFAQNLQFMALGKHLVMLYRL